jgi:hypothetical protein
MVRSWRQLRTVDRNVIDTTPVWRRTATMFDVVFLITWILVVLGLVLYLFYWNRVLGLLLSLLVRVLSWNQASASTWIDIGTQLTCLVCVVWRFPNGCIFLGSIRFSILAGRILFKDLRYHTSNQTIRIVKGQISWRYWIRKPTKEDDLRHARVGAEDVGRKSGLSSMSAFTIDCDQGRQHGQWRAASIYQCRERNGFFTTALPHTTILYLKCQEGLFTDLTQRRPNSLRPLPEVSIFTQVRICKHPGLSLSEPDYDYPPRTQTGSASLLAGAPSFIKKTLEWIRSQLPQIDFKDLLPMSMEVEKGAIICGNASTPNLLVAEYTKAEGTYGILPVNFQFLPTEIMKLIIFTHSRDPSVTFINNS